MTGEDTRELPESIEDLPTNKNQTVMDTVLSHAHFLKEVSSYRYDVLYAQLH